MKKIIIVAAFCALALLVKADITRIVIDCNAQRILLVGGPGTRPAIIDDRATYDAITNAVVPLLGTNAPAAKQ